MNPEVAGSSPASRSSPGSVSGETVESNVLDDAGSSPARSAKLYVVGRADLPVGLRTAQIGHALIHWVLRFGEPPDNLVVLQVADEKGLLALHRKAYNHAVDCVDFEEPDLDDQLTAIALGPEAWRLVSSLPLLR